MRRPRLRRWLIAGFLLGVWSIVREMKRQGRQGRAELDQERDQAAREVQKMDKVDKASWESFPASDSPGWRT